jgi:hypothetical protein
LQNERNGVGTDVGHIDDTAAQFKVHRSVVQSDSATERRVKLERSKKGEFFVSEREGW